MHNVEVPSVLLQRVCYENDAVTNYENDAVTNYENDAVTNYALLILVR